MIILINDKQTWVDGDYDGFIYTLGYKEYLKNQFSIMYQTTFNPLISKKFQNVIKILSFFFYKCACVLPKCSAGRIFIAQYIVEDQKWMKTMVDSEYLFQNLMQSSLFTPQNCHTSLKERTKKNEVTN